MKTHLSLRFPGKVAPTYYPTVLLWRVISRLHSHWFIHLTARIPLKGALLQYFQDLHVYIDNNFYSYFPIPLSHCVNLPKQQIVSTCLLYKRLTISCKTIYNIGQIITLFILFRHFNLIPLNAFDVLWHLFLSLLSQSHFYLEKLQRLLTHTFLFHYHGLWYPVYC